MAKQSIFINPDIHIHFDRNILKRGLENKMADKKTSGNGNGNGSSSHEYINEAGIGNADDEDYCKKVY